MSNANIEILQIAESVAREKGITIDQVLNAMETAIQVAGRRKYGNEQNIKAEISHKNGDIKLYKVLQVVESPENLITQISLEDAMERDPNAKIGDEILENLPPIDLGRIAAQSAKQVIIQRVKDSEREKQYEDFKDRVGEILSGIVKRVEFGEVTIDLGRTEAVIKKDQQIRTENFKINDRVRAYVKEVVRKNKGPQIFLSRTDDMFLAKLMELEMPEIYDGQIEIRAVARDPGSKAKVSVYSSDTTIDPVGSCIGVKGNRIKSITNELSGEKIDVILWSKDTAKYIINSIAPAVISKVVIHEDRKAAELIVPNDQLSIAIGRKGQNVRLASKITGWHLEILTEDQESSKRLSEFNSTTEVLINSLEIEEVMAQLLVSEGYLTLEQIATEDVETIASIEGFDINLAAELKSRAENVVEEKNNKLLEKLENLGVEQELLDILAISLEQLIILAENGVKTVEDLAELDINEFKTILPELKASDEDIQDLLNLAKSRTMDPGTEGSGNE
ncbi:MAG: transcription termination factor NusA [Rickettsiaceae bacterium]|nr:transcription termination factor NusA [Rickettsiaceae bacterium]